jgi:hypothetical protein
MATPMIDDIELRAVQWARQTVKPRYVRQEVATLEGTLHQRIGRHSHRVALRGYLVGETAMDDLKTLQGKAKDGAEVTFTSDITTALEVEKMVIEAFSAEQVAGAGNQFLYELTLAESPPLPPPAEVSAFGGLDEFGLGDLGFDPGALGDIVGDIAAQAGGIMDTLDSAIAAVEGVAALASLGDLASITNPMRPLTDRVADLGSIGPSVASLATALAALAPGDGG